MTTKETQIEAIGGFSPEDLQTMKHTLATGTNDQQFNLFIRTAAASGLNPFLNHIYAIVYQGKMSLQIGIEGIAYLAKQKEGFQGYDAQVVYENELFKPTRNKDGIWEIEHEPDVFQSDDAKIMGAYAVAYRDGFKPYTVIMKFSEVEHFQKSSIPNQQTMWKRYTADMFKKHVLKRALKGQFGIDIADDDGQPAGGASDIPAYTPPAERKDITEEADAAMHTEPAAAPPDDPAAKMKEARRQLTAKFKQLGILDDQSKLDYIAQHAGPKGDRPTLAEITALLKLMDLHIEEKNAAAEDGDTLL